METSEIAEWYKDQHVFVTGATGFMGKIMVEKLLRSCPDVAAVYMIIRNKKNKTATQRLEEFLSCPVFDNIKQQPNAKTLLKKLKCISGDITEQNCGMSSEDREFLEKTITTVFHLAANVKFDQPIKTAIQLNTGGTLNVLEWACKLEKLKVFVHVSTSYCHCHVTKLEEKLYDAPQDPRKMLDLVSWMSDELLETLTPTILRNYPNSYAYTKGLTEHLVAEFSKKLPIAITRPSLVTAAYKDPIPGWIDNLNGPTGIVVGAGKGVIRTMHCNKEYTADIVPVDMAINSLLTIAWKVGKTPKTKEAEVFNITANRDDILSWGEALEICRKHVYNYPFSICLWYPGGSPKSNYFVHCIAAFFFHIIPAYFVDLLLTLAGQKTFGEVLKVIASVMQLLNVARVEGMKRGYRRRSCLCLLSLINACAGKLLVLIDMVRVQKKVSLGLRLLQYYTTRSWYFHNEKSTELYKNMNPVDKEIFYCNREKIDYDKYFLNYILATRKYCVKEDPSTLPHARKILRRLYYLDVLKNIIFWGLLLWLLYGFVTKFLTAILA